MQVQRRQGPIHTNGSYLRSGLKLRITLKISSNWSSLLLLLGVPSLDSVPNCCWIGPVPWFPRVFVDHVRMTPFSIMIVSSTLV